MSGFIYILSNESMPGLLKIGFTERHPLERLKELQSTGVPTPFKLEFAMWDDHAKESEHHLHDVFKDHRCSKRREFFEVNLSNVVAAYLMHGIPGYHIVPTEEYVDGSTAYILRDKSGFKDFLEESEVSPGDFVTYFVESLPEDVVRVHSERVKDQLERRMS